MKNIFILLLLTIQIGCWNNMYAQKQKNQQPNFVVVFIDDGLWRYWHSRRYWLDNT